MKKCSFLFVILVLLFSCSKQGELQDSSKALTLINANLISDRPQNINSVVTIVSLNQPALFEKLKDGNIDEELKKRIIEEQALAFKNLQTISKDIILLYSYKFVMNALAVVTPSKFLSEIQKIEEVSSVAKETSFDRPLYIKANSNNKVFGELTSVNFIAADKVHNEFNVKGQGMRVGIIDTGIDYTHAMFGGEGTEAAYKKIDPNTANEIYPSDKVVGGIDLVGGLYSPAAIDFDHRIPKPDLNPIDESGHGSHVAGSVAGRGDNKNTYDGVAPEAKLFAIKVFGKKGGTGEAVIVAALEYAADPNGDLDPSDKLDVVNLSLGGGYGKPHNLYTTAAKNLVNGGVIMVASAGNSGHTSYIVGSPGTSADAISVAASIDGMEKNWQFKSVSFQAGLGDFIYTEVLEGAISRPVADSEDIKAKLIFAGTAATDFSEELKTELKNNIALIDRGGVSFVEKLKRAYDAGAIGVIMANNKPSAPISMGGEGKVDLPAIMITLDLATSLKENMKAGDVIANFGSKKTINKPQLVDTLTSFSSRGPRSNDSLIKPEVSGPGYQIISAAMGSGNKGVPFNGTSMSAPHVAGVMALLKQHRKELSAKELKTILMNTAVLMKDEKGKTYPVAMQGAGRVDTYKAATAVIMASPYSLSLGETSLMSTKTLRRKMTLKNISDKDMVLKSEVISSADLDIRLPVTIMLAKGESKEFDIFFKLTQSTEATPISERDAMISFKFGDIVIARVPVLTLVKSISKVEVSKFNISATELTDSEGAVVSLEMTNKSSNKGDVLLFNSLGEDKRKPVIRRELRTKSRSCDLEKAGYRIIKKSNKTFLQIGIKLYAAVSRWQACEVSVQLDINNDQVADQEIGGIYYENLQGLDQSVEPGYYSVLLDAAKARKIRADYESASLADLNIKAEDPNYLAAVLDLNKMIAYSHSTVSVVEVDLDAIKLAKNGQLKLKLGVLHEDSDASESDDYLGELEDQWLALSLNEKEQGFRNLPAKIEIAAGRRAKVLFDKGAGNHELLILSPLNRSKGERSLTNDAQSINVRPIFDL
jgi:minor extracellular serine protease Vpr